MHIVLVSIIYSVKWSPALPTRVHCALTSRLVASAASRILHVISYVLAASSYVDKISGFGPPSICREREPRTPPAQRRRVKPGTRLTASMKWSISVW